MSKSIRKVISAALLGLFIIVCMTAPARGARQEALDFSAVESVVAEELRATGTPGAAIAIVCGDRVIYAKAFGVASAETNQPLTVDMLFRLGSTTKMFTGAALAVMAERGRLRLDTPIGDVVKGLHPSLARLTAHHLLSNSAGLRDFGVPGVSQDEAALARMVREWEDDVFFTEPGKIYSYSSAGFWLAGVVLEEAGGKPYADMMDELLFQPVGMPRTTFRPLAAMTYPLAIGHAPGGPQSPGPVVIRPAFNNTMMWPAGSIFSNAPELARWAMALMNGGRVDGREALPAAAIEKIMARQINMPGDDSAYYGYGLLSFEERGVRYVMHGGFSRGYGSMIQMAPAQRFAIIVLTNRSGETLPKTREKIIQLALPLKAAAESKPPTPLSANEAARYVGVYRHAPAEWEIFIREGKLFLRYEGAESALTRSGEHRFTTDAGEEYVLVMGSDGRAEYLFNGLYAARRAGG